MNNKIKFSVLINNYNYERYVGKAIESVLAQTYSNIEIIVVDDGSTDNSIGVINKFSSDILLIQKNNGGQGSTFNSGFDRITGDLVIVLDSDDYLFPEACAEIANLWKEDAVMYCYCLRVCGPDGDLLNEELPETPLLESGQKEHILSYGYIPVAPMSGVAYSREYLSNFFPLDESIWKGGFDHLFSFVAPVAGPVVSIKKLLGAYRMGHVSRSQHGAISLGKFRKNLQTSELYAKAISENAFEFLGVEKNYEDLLGPYFWKNRMVSICIDDGGHQFTEDRKIKIFLRGVRAFCLWPEISLIKRMKNIIQLLAMTVLPSRWVVAFVSRNNYIKL